MKKLFQLLTIAFLLSTLSSFSQEQFNYIYEQYEIPNGENIFALSDTGYVLVGAVMINSKLYISALFTDIYGTFTHEKYYGDDSSYHYRGGAENSCIKTDGGYILAGYKGLASQDTNMIYLVKFDEQFDTLWTKKYFVDTNWVIARGICNTDDGGYMIVGETKLNNDSVSFSNHVKGLMLKVDADGNYQWFKSFGTNDFADYFYKVVQTHDGGYLVGGSTNSWQEPLWYPDLGDWYVVKTDANGNEEWNRRYGNPSLDDGRMTGILRARDTSYYLTGGYTYDRNNTGSVLNSESYIIKLDQNFNEVYELKYDNQLYYKSYAGDPIESLDSNIIIIGHRLMGQGSAYEMRTTMHKITPDGEVLWERQFVADNDTSGAASYGLSVKQTSDGGYIFGGWAYSSSMSPSQQMWLVKTDSAGCDGTGDFWDNCTNVMVNEFVDNPTFEMYPNPANDFIVIASLVMSEVEGEAKQSAESCKIYDLTGKIVKSTSLRGTKQSVQIGDLEKGVYIVRVGKQTKKLIIE